MTDETIDPMDDLLATVAEEKVVDLFLHHKNMLITGFVRHNGIDLHNDGICIGMAVAYEILTGENIDDAITKLYPPSETVEDMMADLPPTPNEVTH